MKKSFIGVTAVSVALMCVCALTLSTQTMTDSANEDKTYEEEVAPISYEVLGDPIPTIDYSTLTESITVGSDISSITTQEAKTEKVTTKKNQKLRKSAKKKAEVETTQETTTTTTTVAATQYSGSPSNRWNITVSDAEFEMLCQITWMESGNQCDEGQQAVVEVILNRVYADYMPNTIEGVLSQNGQFSTWYIRDRAQVTDQVRSNVEKVLNGETNILPYETIYFSVSPMNDRIQAHIQGHYFCNR